MTPHDPDDDWDGSSSDLDALDFATPVVDDGDDESGLDALSDYPAGDDNREKAELDAFEGYVHADAQDDEYDEFGSPAPDDAEDEDQIPVVQAANPPGTVTVTAYMNGSPARVDLDPKATMLTESALAEEIRVVTDVATKKATAVMHMVVVKMLVDQGMDFQEARDFVETNMPFATPEQAGEAELALVARHAHRDE